MRHEGSGWVKTQNAMEISALVYETDVDNSGFHSHHRDSPIDQGGWKKHTHVVTFKNGSKRSKVVGSISQHRGDFFAAIQQHHYAGTDFAFAVFQIK